MLDPLKIWRSGVLDFGGFRGFSDLQSVSTKGGMASVEFGGGGVNKHWDPGNQASRLPSWILPCGVL